MHSGLTRGLIHGDAFERELSRVGVKRPILSARKITVASRSSSLFARCAGTYKLGNEIKESWIEIDRISARQMRECSSSARQWRRWRRREIHSFVSAATRIKFKIAHRLGREPERERQRVLRGSKSNFKRALSFLPFVSLPLTRNAFIFPSSRSPRLPHLVLIMA